MAKQHYIRQAAAELKQEASDNARAVAAALAPPDDAHDSVKLSRGEVVALVRQQSLEDDDARMRGAADPTQPTYLQRKLDEMAPVVATLPGGTKLRAANGVKYFHELVKEARPDVYAAITGDLRPLQRRVDAQEER